MSFNSTLNSRSRKRKRNPCVKGKPRFQAIIHIRNPPPAPKILAATVLQGVKKKKIFGCCYRREAAQPDSFSGKYREKRRLNSRFFKEDSKD